MKPVCCMLLFVLLAFITSSSFVCIKPHKTVAIDSIQYFKPRHVILMSDCFNDTTIELKLNNNYYTFSKDTSTSYHLFKANKDDKNIYVLINISPSYIDDTSMLTTIKYQTFNKISLTNTSKVFKLEDVSFSLKTLKKFMVSKENFDKVFADKGK